MLSTVAQLTGVPLAVACAALLTVTCAAPAADLKLDIPPIKASLNLEGQPTAITVWGSISTASSGVFRLSLVVDLSDLQKNLVPLLGAQLNRSDRCGERLTVQGAELAPAPPSGILTAYVHYERFGCVKALGKEIVRRLVGGNGVVEVNVAPSVVENRPALTAQVRKIDADGSLGEVLSSGSLRDTIREKLQAGIESAIQKAASLKSTLPAGIEDGAVLQTVQFSDGGAGHLWLKIDGEVRLTDQQFHGLAGSWAPGLTH